MHEINSHKAFPRGKNCIAHSTLAELDEGCCEITVVQWQNLTGELVGLQRLFLCRSETTQLRDLLAKELA